MRFSESSRSGKTIFTTHYDSYDELGASIVMGFLMKMFMVICFVIGLGIGLSLLFNTLFPNPDSRIQVMSFVTIFAVVGVWFNFYKSGLYRILTGILAAVLGLICVILVNSYALELSHIVNGTSTQGRADGAFVVWLIFVGLIGLMGSFTSPFMLAWMLLTNLFDFIVYLVKKIYNKRKEAVNNAAVVAKPQIAAEATADPMPEEAAEATPDLIPAEEEKTLTVLKEEAQAAMEKAKQAAAAFKAATKAKEEKISKA